MSRDDDMPSELLLEQLALDEAPRDVVTRLGPRLQDDDVRERLDAMRVEDEAILAAYPPRRALAIVRARADAAKGTTPRSIHWLLTIPVVVALAAMLVLLLRSPDVLAPRGPDDAIAYGSDVRVVPDDVRRELPSDVRPSDVRPSDVRPSDVRPSDVRPSDAKTTQEDGIRIKGQQPHLVIHRRESDGPVRLHDDSIAHARDLLQLGYVAAGRAHGVIVSIDGAGAVTLHFPDAVDGSTALEQGEVVALTHAYELDDAPSFERFVLVTADAPIDAATVVQAAEQLAETPKRARAKRLALPSRWQQSSLVLRKAEP